MMLTRFVRIQLMVFTVVGSVGMFVMVSTYMQVPTLLGVGHLTVYVQLPDTGGLYRFSNVTYRGVQIGKVTAIKATETGAEATLSLDTSPPVPADIQADVRSLSAVGEQYLDLEPRGNPWPYLENGSVIRAERTSVGRPVGPVLDEVSALVKLNRPDFDGDSGYWISTRVWSVRSVA